MSSIPSLSELRANLYYGLTGTSQIVMYEPSPSSLVIKDFTGSKDITYVSFDTTNNLLNIPTGTVLDISSANITNLNVTNFTGITQYGLTGSAGSIGNQGYQGIQGILGVISIEGSQGIQGFQGAQGLPGSNVGNQGRQGPQGFQGVQGGGALIILNDGYNRLITSNNTSTGGTVQSNLIYNSSGVSRLTVGGNISATGLYIQSSINYTGGAININLSKSQNIVEVGKNADGTFATRVLSQSGTNVSIGYDVVADLNGNCYVTGSFVSPGQVLNSDGTLFTTLSGSGSTECFIVKYGPTGMCSYTTRISGTTIDVGYGIAVDGNGNIYVTGRYDTPSIVYNSDGTFFNTLSGSGGTECFIVKYGPTGMGNYATRISGTTNDFGYGIAVDGNGNSYVTGTYTTLTVVYNSDGTAFTTLNGSGGTDCFIVKYGPTGMGNYASRISGTTNDVGYGIAVDGNGNSYVTGNYISPATVYNSDGTPFQTLSGSGSSDIFIVKYGSTGMGSFVTRISGTLADSGRGIAVDSVGNSYITGNFNTRGTFYNSDGTTYKSLSVGGNAVFAAKYNPTGMGIFVSLVESAGSELGYGIDIDSSGNCYICGTMDQLPLNIINSDNTIFQTITNDVEAGFNVSTIVKFGPTGMGQFYTTLFGGNTPTPYGIAVNNSGDIFVTGNNVRNLSIYNSDNQLYKSIPGSVSSYCSYIVKYTSQYVLTDFSNISENNGRVITLTSQDPIQLSRVATKTILGVIYNTYTFTSFITLIFYNGSWYVLAKN